ncbi:hypothetical protein FLX56_21405 [Synechococcus moorigangaii CMS01]|nr:hypothetical protein [Synechococcus moorigangaii CMS01]
MRSLELDVDVERAGRTGCDPEPPSPEWPVKQRLVAADRRTVRNRFTASGQTCHTPAGIFKNQTAEPLSHRDDDAVQGCLLAGNYKLCTGRRVADDLFTILAMPGREAALNRKAQCCATFENVRSGGLR